MITSLPVFIPVVFGLTAIAALLLFYFAMRARDATIPGRRANLVLDLLILWLIVQAAVTLKDVYNAGIMASPPRIVLFAVLPVMLVIVLLFITKGGRRFLDGLSLRWLTWLHMVRIPVELVLYWLSLEKAVPALMTFAGWNFDILAGLSAPFMAWMVFARGGSRKILLAWNIICLALLLNIMVIAFLSAPSPLQALAFDQPNVGMMNFPFSWLPAFVAPLVLLAHLSSIRRIIRDFSVSRGNAGAQAPA